MINPQKGIDLYNNNSIISRIFFAVTIFQQTKHVLRYLHGMVGYGPRYVSNDEVKLQGYTDFDWVGSVVDRKSTLGCCFSLGSSMISWLGRKHSLVALTTTEVEYIATNVASREVVWLRKLLAELFDLELEPTLIYCDNQSCVKLSENPVFHDKSKHIEIKYHFHMRPGAERSSGTLVHIHR
jgi:hypothetical protein